MFGHGIKQVQTLKKDLAYFESNYTNAPLSTQGQISVSITGLNRTINELNDLVSKETNQENKQKYNKRIDKFRNELSDLKLRFDSIKKRKEEVTLENSRSELLNRGARFHGGTPGSAAVVGSSTTTSTDNPYSSSTTSSSAAVGSHQQQQQQRGSGMSYKEGLYKEHNSLGRSSQQLDEILEMGQASFDDIVTQNEYLIKFEKKLSSSLVTLGVSRATIQQIERRVYKDRFVFFIGAIFTIMSFYFIYKYLG